MASCGGDGAQMRQQLEALEQQNRSGEQMLDDSLAESLVDYFDHHGDANERMRARYILGRTYYCMGELPRALETYYEAADCADTTLADCDYKVLSRIHAQSAAIFHSQVQPSSQIKELRFAEYYAWKGKDSLQAIECLSQQSGAYDFLNMPDSVIVICESSSDLFVGIGRIDRASQMKGRAISSLIKKREYEKAKRFLDEYEHYSGLLLGKDSLSRGHEIYYYTKGRYYIATNQLDSAEFLFRKELREGKDLNNQIAASTGLQKVYEQRKKSDSIAKYASIAYKLNDSAYSLSEMQNMQMLQASYNYSHHKYIAQQKRFEAKIAWLTSILVILLSLFLLRLFFKRYRLFKNAALDFRLRNAEITQRFHRMAKSQPLQYPSLQDWRDLRSLVEHKIPSFKKILCPEEKPPISDMDYDVCVAIRVNLSPIEISKLKQCSPATITKIRKRLLSSIFGVDGSAESFDDEIGKMGCA
jgi:tetratricopeptide (TPR) repeat protein